MPPNVALSGPEGQVAQVAMVVEDLARERWTGALVRLPRQ